MRTSRFALSRPCGGRATPTYIAAVLLTASSVAAAQVTVTEINPNSSTLHAIDPDGASGGRVNGLSRVLSNSLVFYAASEWGGLHKTIDGGRTWFRLNRHLPTATWHVSADLADSGLVYATSFFDGRVNSLAGINVSSDGGNHWTHPSTATPPAGFCSNDRRTEPSAFGISVDAKDPGSAYIGTNCGLAISHDHGVTWRFVNPTPGSPALNVWDVVAHNHIIDLCGDDGHFRSVNDGTSWTSGTGLPSGVCSITVSPSDSNVLFVAVATNVYESDNAGVTWTNLGTPDFRRQGRVPFVAVNSRSVRGDTFDLWFGDVSLYRGACTVLHTPRCPMAATGAPGGTPPSGWSGPFTRGVGGHDDVGDIVFDPRATTNACPVLFSSDGGVYFNTKSTNPDCQSPVWQQPNVSPHGLWLFAMDGAHRPSNQDLYFGNQDNGAFAATDAGAASPTWRNTSCCDGFDFVADAVRVVYTICCGFGIYVDVPGLGSPVALATNPPGSIPMFQFPDFIARFGDNQYVAVTSEGAFVTTNIAASPVTWTQLGAGSSPSGGFCTVKVAVSGGTPTFYAQGPPWWSSCLHSQLWKFVGSAPGGAWQRVDNTSGLSGGIGIYAVDPKNPNRLYASNLSPTGPRMVFSTDGGATWTNDPGLDNLMTGGGAFLAQPSRGPTNFTGFGIYQQPSLIAFDPDDPNTLIAGGIDSGVFLTTDAGATWQLVTDPLNSGTSGVPHIPRPWFAYFDHSQPGNVNAYVGTQGRGVWRIGFRPVQAVAFEYAAKIVCGVQRDPRDTRLARGFYATTINIHNPNAEGAEVSKQLALTFPPPEQEPGRVIAIATDRLGPGQALKTDCVDIARRVFPKGLPAPYIEGFVVIRSALSLDVTAVYSTASLDGRGAVTTQSGIDVEQIRERQVKPMSP